MFELPVRIFSEVFLKPLLSVSKPQSYLLPPHLRVTRNVFIIGNELTFFCVLETQYKEKGIVSMRTLSAPGQSSVIELWFFSSLKVSCFVFGERPPNRIKPNSGRWGSSVPCMSVVSFYVEHFFLISGHGRFKVVGTLQLEQTMVINSLFLAHSTTWKDT